MSIQDLSWRIDGDFLAAGIDAAFDNDATRRATAERAERFSHLSKRRKRFELPAVSQEVSDGSRTQPLATNRTPRPPGHAAHEPLACPAVDPPLDDCGHTDG